MNREHTYKKNTRTKKKDCASRCCRFQQCKFTFENLWSKFSFYSVNGDVSKKSHQLSQSNHTYIHPHSVFAQSITRSSRHKHNTFGNRTVCTLQSQHASDRLRKEFWLSISKKNSEVNKGNVSDSRRKFLTRSCFFSTWTGNDRANDRRKRRTKMGI